MVLARMSSSRNPGKIVSPLADPPICLHRLERIGRAETLGGVVIATPTDATNRVRGDLNDGLPGFANAVAPVVTGLQHGDRVSSTMASTQPSDLDVEVVQAGILQGVARTSTGLHECDHVTGDVILSHLRWAVDAADDCVVASDAFDALCRHQHIQRTPVTKDGMRNSASNGLATGVKSD